MTEKTMKQKVRDAIMEHGGFYDEDDVWIGISEEDFDWNALAATAIAAMREASGAMAEAAYEASSMSDAWCIEDDTDWRRSYRAAIDAALFEGTSHE